MSIRTPSAASTSAEPLAEETARFRTWRPGCPPPRRRTPTWWIRRTSLSVPTRPADVDGPIRQLRRRRDRGGPSEARRRSRRPRRTPLRAGPSPPEGPRHGRSRSPRSASRPPRAEPRPSRASGRPSPTSARAAGRSPDASLDEVLQEVLALERQDRLGVELNPYEGPREVAKAHDDQSEVWAVTSRHPGRHSRSTTREW